MRIMIDIPDDIARRIEEHIANATSDFNSRGPLALQKLMEMVAEDVGLTTTSTSDLADYNARVDKIEAMPELDRARAERDLAEAAALRMTRALANVIAKGNGLRAENEKLRDRLGSRGLVVVMIGSTGHYVSDAVAAEIERLKAERDIGRQDAAVGRDRLFAIIDNLRARVAELEGIAAELAAERVLTAENDRPRAIADRITTTDADWMALQVDSGMIVVRRSQYDALLAFYSAWGECETAAAIGDMNLLAVATKALAEKREMVDAELRVPVFGVVKFRQR